MATVLDAPVAAVWADLADVASHVEWMADAESLDFATDQRQGVGTAYRCVTRVGPIRLDDHMAVTEWVAERAMAVAHRGLVTGQGRFTLDPVASGRRTLFVWAEELAFPWWLGGPMGEVVGRPILTSIWRGNLRRFAERHASVRPRETVSSTG